jgi:hypothetical protein
MCCGGLQGGLCSVDGELGGGGGGGGLGSDVAKRLMQVPAVAAMAAL